MPRFRIPYPQAALLCLTVGAVLLAGISPVWIGSTSESVTISVSVIGSSSSASSVSSSSSSSSARSVATVDDEEKDRGGRRHSIEQSRLRIIRLIRNWTGRYRMHAAPPAQWYKPAVKTLLEKGYIDEADDLRLNADATRAEVAKLVSLFSGTSTVVPPILSFDDAVRAAWYVPFLEHAGKNGWMIGYKNCYGTHPCIFRPGAVITRSEAAAVFVRVFRLEATHAAPVFRDVPDYAWYRDPVQAAADACILRGNDGQVRPEDLLTRAELFVMFFRAMEGRAYGDGCGTDGIVGSGKEADAGMQEEPGMCSVSLPVCLFQAAREDLQTFVLHPLSAALIWPDISSLGRLPASETGMWVLLLCIPVGIVMYLPRIMRHRKMKK